MANKIRVLPIAIYNGNRYGIDTENMQIVLIGKRYTTSPIWGGNSFNAGINILKHKNAFKILNIMDSADDSIYTLIDNDGDYYKIINIHGNIRLITYKELRELIINRKINCFTLKANSLDDTNMLELYEKYSQEADSDIENNYSNHTAYDRLKQLYYGNINVDDNKISVNNIKDNQQISNKYSRDILVDTYYKLYCEFLEISFVGDRISIPLEIYNDISKEILAILDDCEIIKFKVYTDSGNTTVAVCKHASTEDKTKTNSIVNCQIMWKSENNERLDLDKIKIDYNKWKQSRKYV